MLKSLAVGGCFCAALFTSPDIAVDDGDVMSMEQMEQALETVPKEDWPPPGAVVNPNGTNFTHTDTFDCHGGGTVRVTVQWRKQEEPYAKKYYANWQYSACVTRRHGTIDGTARYSKNNEEQRGYWFTGVHYFAELDYSGRLVGDCNAYMVMTKKTEDRIGDLRLDDHCRHPVRNWWRRMGID